MLRNGTISCPYGTSAECKVWDFQVEPEVEFTIWERGTR